MVQLFDVTWAYGEGAPVLRDLTLHVRAGEFVFVTGPSGAGKSTLLRMIFGARRPSRGQVIVHGRNTQRMGTRARAQLRRQMGVVFQDYRLLPGRTVADNIGLALEVAGRPAAEVQHRTLNILRQLDLADRAASLPPRLSGGEQQRVALARALVHGPALLLADEPTGNLDAERARHIAHLLEVAHREGTTVLVATHDEGWLARTPQARVVRLAGGRVAEA